ncbi:MAG: type II toxin-antitoxin system RelE/ParE family toxin [Desulfovibrio sp.]|jgi:toxin ParE1/3/4|nr:type II toxin-antitoxin system RelE/ParE family toxin [Desulfovibrio sp.]
MSCVVLWTDKAAADLERAYLFLKEKSEEAAVAAIKAIREKAVLLEQFPNAGRPADDLDPEHRELLIPFGASGYVLLYRVENAFVYILDVRHQKEAGY